MSDSTMNRLIKGKVDVNGFVQPATIAADAPASDKLQTQMDRIDQKTEIALQKAEQDKKRLAEKAKREKEYQTISLLVNRDYYKQIKIWSTNDDRFVWELIDEAIRNYIQNRKSN